MHYVWLLLTQGAGAESGVFAHHEASLAQERAGGVYGVTAGERPQLPRQSSKFIFIVLYGDALVAREAAKEKPQKQTNKQIGQKWLKR